jgi:probable rRNA maturation factor
MARAREPVQREPVDVGIQRGIRSGTRSGAPGDARIRRWACAALGARGAGRELAVRLVGAAEGRRLNAAWRGKDYATNVLSFPPPRMGRRAAPRGAARGPARAALGDLVICVPVVRREAREQGKALAAHWAHMVVHGSLHLLGYDHERAADARRMERRERRVLAALGFDNPYHESEP